MYAAPQDRQKEGSTKDHKDMCGAINMMTWAKHDGLTGEHGAMWDIVKSDEADQVSNFLRDKLELTDRSPDPLHDQRTFLDDATLEDLYLQVGVVPFRVVQKPGDMILIPPGAPHQVCILGSSRIVALIGLITA